MAEVSERALLLLLEEMKRVLSSAPVPAKEKPAEIPIGISNHHVHLSQTDLDQLFGPGYQLTPVKDLSQPGQFACRETVTVCGPKGAIEKLRILGPVRSQTQIEILAGDCFKIGAVCPARLSGDLKGTPGVTIIGPKGSVQTPEGMIVAQRHIHMTPEDAQNFNVKDGQIVSIRVPGSRGGVYGNVFAITHRPLR